MRVGTTSTGALSSVANALEEGNWRHPSGRVTSPNGVAGVGVAGRMGTSRDGCELVRATVLFLVE